MLLLDLGHELLAGVPQSVRSADSAAIRPARVGRVAAGALGVAGRASFGCCRYTVRYQRFDGGGVGSLPLLSPARGPKGWTFMVRSACAAVRPGQMH